MSQYKTQKSTTHSVLHVHTTFNNTIVTATDASGNTLVQSSGGRVGYKNAKKSTQHAALLAVQKVLEDLRAKHPIKTMSIIASGLGVGREPVVRTVASFELSILSYTDVTGVAHNGTRGKGERRA